MTPAFVLCDVGVAYILCASRVVHSGVHITCVCVSDQRCLSDCIPHTTNNASLSAQHNRLNMCMSFVLTSCDLTVITKSKPGYNDIGLCEISSKAWYQFNSVNRNVILFGYNNTRLQGHKIFSSFHDVITEFDSTLTLNLPMTTIVAQPFNVIKWQLKFNPVA